MPDQPSSSAPNPVTGTSPEAGRLETVVRLDMSSIKYGYGATREVGYDMRALGSTRVMVVTDPGLRSSRAVGLTLDSLRAEGVEAVLYDRARVEPTDTSLKDVIAFARDGRFDGYVGVGGGSSMDTAKVANLYTTYPAEFLAYVNAPIGEGRPVPGPVAPLIAIPTTAGTGSEATGVAIFDFEEMGAKTGIAHRNLRPALGIVDPENARTMPAMVAACSGFDVLCHALESYTNLPFDRRPAPANPGLRPAYQGRNPVSDVWSGRTIQLAAANIVGSVHGDETARDQMVLAATFAGIGFANAGLHLCHGMSYAISGQVREYRPAGYPQDHATVPHGMAVVLGAPAIFRFTAPADPVRHLEAARLMGVDVSRAHPEDAGELLAAAIIDLMRQTGIPNGISAVGYGPDDVDALVTGTLPQQRLLGLSPRPVGVPELRALFLDSMTCW